VIGPYLARFKIDSAVPGIAREIAQQLGVVCTAARDGDGTQFFHRDGQGRVQPTKDNKQYKEPIFMWKTKSSRWVSYGKDGNALADVVMFQKKRTSEEAGGDKPPAWLVKGYDSGLQ
jgi:hypothetical protein